MDENYLIPHVFTRHKLHLHALLLQNQPWFCARDLGRLLRIYLNDRQLRKLDPDQYQTAKPLIHGHIENTLLISESGVYALRDAQHPATTERPQLSLLNWPEMSLSLLHWNNQPWIRLQDVPQMMTEREQARRTVKPWWKRASLVLQSL
jgi:prophage antirepressor-like protein